VGKRVIFGASRWLEAQAALVVQVIIAKYNAVVVVFMGVIPLILHNAAVVTTQPFSWMQFDKNKFKNF
jgi:hypothetical protein